MSDERGHLHLTALGDDNIEVGHVLDTMAGLNIFHLLDNVHAINDFAENNVLVVKEGSGDCGDEELGAVGVGAGVLRWCQFRLCSS
jgi:hypothetical protein